MSTLAVAARWMIAVPAGLLFMLCVVGNWSLLVGILIGRVKSRASLVMPFLGPALGIVFLVAVPIPSAIHYWWVALLAEPTWLLGLWCIVTAGLMRLGRSRDA